MTVLPRALQVPRVAYTERPNVVVVRTPSNPTDANEYLETTMDPDTAECYGLELIRAAIEARAWIKAEKRRAK